MYQVKKDRLENMTVKNKATQSQKSIKKGAK
jgi:hypothetical protein